MWTVSTMVGVPKVVLVELAAPEVGDAVVPEAANTPGAAARAATIEHSVRISTDLRVTDTPPGSRVAWLVLYFGVTLPSSGENRVWGG